MARIQKRSSGSSGPIGGRVLRYVRSMCRIVPPSPFPGVCSRTVCWVYLLIIAAVFIQSITHIVSARWYSVAFSGAALMVILVAAYLAVTGRWTASTVLAGIVTLVIFGTQIVVHPVPLSEPILFGPYTYFVMQPVHLIGVAVLSLKVWPVVLVNAIGLAFSLIIGSVVLPESQWVEGVFAVATVLWGIPMVVSVTLHRLQRNLTRRVQEQNLFLRESHHRAKNQIALLSSLVAIHPETGPIGELKNSLFARLRAMADVQELLQESSMYGTVELQPLVQRLVRSTVESAYRDDFAVHVSVVGEPIPVPGEWAPKIGVFTVELLLNAQKHAFVGRNSGAIEIRLERQESTTVFRYHDDGVGLPPDLNPKATDSLGLALMVGIARDLDAELTFDSSDGLSVAMTLPAVQSAHL